MPLHFFLAPSRKAMLSVRSPIWAPCHVGSFTEDGEEWYQLKPCTTINHPHYLPYVGGYIPWLVFDTILGSFRVECTVDENGLASSKEDHDVTYVAREWCETIAASLIIIVHDVPSASPFNTQEWFPPGTDTPQDVFGTPGCTFNEMPFWWFNEWNPDFWALEDVLTHSAGDDVHGCAFTVAQTWATNIRFSVGTEKVCLWETIPTDFSPESYAQLALAVGNVMRSPGSNRISWDYLDDTVSGILIEKNIAWSKATHMWRRL